MPDSSTADLARIDVLPGLRSGQPCIRGLLTLAVRQGTTLALKLLFDANLSPKLVKRLEDLFPDTSHNGFAIVTTDADFLAMAERLGPPPKVIRLKNCNYKTAKVEELLRRNAIRISDLERSDQPTLIVRNVLGPPRDTLDRRKRLPLHADQSALFRVVKRRLRTG